MTRHGASQAASVARRSSTRARDSSVDCLYLGRSPRGPARRLRATSRFGGCERTTGRSLQRGAEQEPRREFTAGRGRRALRVAAAVHGSRVRRTRSAARTAWDDPVRSARESGASLPHAPPRRNGGVTQRAAQQREGCRGTLKRPPSRRSPPDRPRRELVHGDCGPPMVLWCRPHDILPGNTG